MISLINMHQNIFLLFLFFNTGIWARTRLHLWMSGRLMTSDSWWLCKQLRPYSTRVSYRARHWLTFDGTADSFYLFIILYNSFYFYFFINLFIIFYKSFLFFLLFFIIIFIFISLWFFLYFFLFFYFYFLIILFIYLSIILLFLYFIYL